MKYIDSPVLAIESSCDETSVAIVQGTQVLANVVSSQAELHKKWGGVVPEAAARMHTEAIIPALETALSNAGLGLKEISGIGVTNRPGLIGALSVGVTAAKGLAFALGKPMLGVHHLEGHVLSPLMVADVPFPHLCLLVSGGHTEMIRVHAPGEYEKVGGTIDDAAGEAFDKCARALGLGYPGGPAIQRAAGGGDPRKYHLPAGLKGPTRDFSFSGLKTAVLYLARDEAERLDVASAAASVEETICSVLTERTAAASVELGARAVTLVGGVAANKRLRAKLLAASEERGLKFFTPPFELCTDNAAMIGHVACWRFGRGERDGFDLDTLASTPISEINNGANTRTN
jgi:N6-L-threonylcarbamoyladenine synthase